MRKGWEIKKLNELFDVKSSKRVHKADWKTEGVPFYRAREVVKLAQNGTVDNALFISEKLFKEFAKEKGAPKEGDIIISAVGTLGQCYLVKESDKFYFKDASVLWFENISNVDTRYIEYSFKSDLVMKQVLNKSMGATVGTLTISRAKIIQIPIPPLQEQKQIVALLDKIFTAIDQAKANIEKNIVNAKELFQSKLNAIFSQKGDGWEEKMLKEITTKIGSGATPRGGQSSYKESGISLIRSMNVHDDGFRDRKLAFIDDEQARKLNNVTIEENDVLLNITGASVARCCIVDNHFLPARVNQHVSIIRLKEGIMSNKFLHFALTSKETKNLLLGIGEQGATRQAITKVQIENFKIAFPSKIEVQDELLKSLGVLQKKTIQIESNYIKKLADLEELKKSILQKAFSGELTQKEVEV
jgi:type I restriction enzyme S subunit